MAIKSAAGAALVVSVILSACGNDTAETNTQPTAVTLPAVQASPTTQVTPESEVEETTPPETGAPSEASDQDPAAQEPTSVGLRLVGEFNQPLAALSRTGDSRLFLLERTGRVVPIDPESGKADRAVLDISNDVSSNVERGLLGGAFSIDGSVLYLHYSDRNGDTQLDSWDVDPSGSVDTGSRTPLYSLKQPFPNHNGGQVALGPDGFLYLGLGDGGAADDPLEAGQDTSTALGAILRIDPTRGDPYAIPADNPFASGGGEPEIFLTGVRNPWRFSFDRATGDLWVGDVGQNKVEEVTVLRAADGGGLGTNLGWNLREGTLEFAGDEPVGHVGPIHEYSHANDNCSITGGYVYRGQAIPALDGVYIYADYCVGELVTVDQNGTATPLGLSVDGRQVVSFAEDINGEVYVISGAGQLFELVVVES